MPQQDGATTHACGQPSSALPMVPRVGRAGHWTDRWPALIPVPSPPLQVQHGEKAAHRQVSPAMNSRMAAMSSLFQKSLKYRSAIFASPHSSGS